VQAGDAAKIPQVARPDCVTEFQCAFPDREIRQRQVDSLACLFSANTCDDLRRCPGRRVDWNGGFQFIEESPPVRPQFGRVCTVDAMPNLGNAYRAKCDGNSADRFQHTLDPRVTAKRKPAETAIATLPATPALSALDQAVERLVGKYSSGAVIDATWEAAHRIFEAA
jgi:hypothetical protein